MGVNVGRVRLLLASLERKDGRAGVGVEGGLLTGLPSLSGSDSLKKILFKNLISTVLLIPRIFLSISNFR